MIKDFILASGSKPRQKLLEQIGYEPKLIQPADIDETPHKKEKASAYVKRMALEKAQHVAKFHPFEVILACDTIVVSGATIIQKAHSDEEQIKVMQMLSGHAHRVLSAVCLINREGKVSQRLNTTKIHMKKLSFEEIKNYVATKEWVGCSGYKIEGKMEALVQKLEGSYSGVVGLPLCEAKNLLNGAGVK